MKLTTKREELVSKLSIVSRAVSTRAATQALSGVLLTAAEGRVTLAATDLDLGLRDDARGRGRRPRARCCCPAGCWPRSPARSPTPTVEIESREAEHDVEIRSGSSSFHLRVLPAEDFPKLPAPGEEPGLKIPAKELGASIDLVARAASRDDMRPVLTGVFVAASGAEMTMVATDSYRLAVKRTELESELGGEIEANIPARALRELGRILSSEGVERGDGLAADQPGRFRGRVDHPHDEADRGPVPQLSTAPAGVLRARRAPAAHATSSTSPAASASWPSATRRCASPSRPAS